MITLGVTYAGVHFNQKLHAVEIIWKGFATLDQYKIIYDNALEIIA